MISSCVALAAGLVIRNDLRTDGVPVHLMDPGQMEAEFALHSENSLSSTRFSDKFVKHALAEGVDWRDKGAVTPAKDQGAHGYCGTFGRVCAAEGQYALHSGHKIRNFSEEELVECIGWDKNQFDYFAQKGFMSSEQYPYLPANYSGNVDPPIPGHPCKYRKSEVIVGTNDHAFTNVSQIAHDDEEQLAAWIYKNGPVNTGIDAAVMGLRKKGCEATGDCFITKEMCKESQVGIDHSITLVGFGTDEKHGEYWLVKNSWSTKFANDGFIKVARGFKDKNHTNGCAHIACCGWAPCYGNCPDSE